MFVLGIDPGLSRTGYAVVAVEGSRARPIDAGVIRTDPGTPVPERLAELFSDLEALIAEHAPAEAAVEQVFVNRNLQTATSVGRASGVVLAALARAGVAVFEYSPTAVKMALVGYGAAPKDQVQRVLAMRLGLREAPRPADAADALAIALCHVQGAAARVGAGRTR